MFPASSGSQVENPVAAWSYIPVSRQVTRSLFMVRSSATLKMISAGCIAIFARERWITSQAYRRNRGWNGKLGVILTIYGQHDMEARAVPRFRFGVDMPVVV